MPAVVAPFAQRTRRVTDLVRLIGHSAGGRPAERLMQRFGISVSDDTILRHLKQAVKDCGAQPPPRVIGIDDWAWRKGQSYGTILVDLERGTVLDVLEARSASSAAAWLDQHPSVQIVSRDRCGLYAEAVRRGAPQARQVADRFHLIQNLREAIEKQLSHFKQSVQVPPSTTFGPTTLNVDAIPATGDQQRLARQARWVRRQQMFAQVKSLQEAGHTAADIVREMGLSRKRVDKWIRLRVLPLRRSMAPKPCSPAFYEDYLARQWADGNRNGRRLFTEIKGLGYTGCFSYLARFLSPWRRQGQPIPHAETRTREAAVAAPGAISRPTMSPLVAAALCIRPRSLLTARQAQEVDTLKRLSPVFAQMRRFAMRFRGVLRSGTVKKLDRWIKDARRSGIDAINRFARRLARDIEAVRCAVTTPWSKGPDRGADQSAENFEAGNVWPGRR